MFSQGHRRGLFLSLLAIAALSAPASALEPSGSVVRVDRITDAAGPGGTRVLETDSSVFMGDAITTNPNGLAQIRFIDNTRIVVGPNSNLVIDSFVFNPDNTARKVTVSAVKGFFRFISGNSPSSAYSIRTQAMTIGIRGTALDIHASGPTARVVFLVGSGFGTGANGQTTNFEGGCTLYVASAGGEVTTPTGLAAQQQMAAYFPLIQNQSGFDPAFAVDASGCPTVDDRTFGTPASTDSPDSAPETMDSPPDRDPPDEDNGDDEGGCEGGDCGDEGPPDEGGGDA